jgi:hypothetical protein
MRSGLILILENLGTKRQWKKILQVASKNAIEAEANGQDFALFSACARLYGWTEVIKRATLNRRLFQ